MGNGDDSGGMNPGMAVTENGFRIFLGGEPKDASGAKGKNLVAKIEWNKIPGKLLGWVGLGGAAKGKSLKESVPALRNATNGRDIALENISLDTGTGLTRGTLPSSRRRFTIQLTSGETINVPGSTRVSLDSEGRLRQIELPDGATVTIADMELSHQSRIGLDDSGMITEGYSTQGFTDKNGVVYLPGQFYRWPSKLGGGVREAILAQDTEIQFNGVSCILAANTRVSLDVRNNLHIGTLAKAVFIETADQTFYPGDTVRFNPLGNWTSTKQGKHGDEIDSRKPFIFWDTPSNIEIFDRMSSLGYTPIQVRVSSAKPVKLRGNIQGDLGIELHANGEVKSGILAENTKINGVVFAEGTSIFFSEKGKVLEGTLAEDAFIENVGAKFAAGKKISFYGDADYHGMGTVREGTLKRAYEMEIVYAIGQPRTRITFPENTLISFHENGQAHQGTLAKDVRIGLIPYGEDPETFANFKAGTNISFYPNKRIQEGILSEDTALGGIRLRSSDVAVTEPPPTITFKGGTSLHLHNTEGRMVPVSQGTLAKDTRIGDINYLGESSIQLQAPHKFHLGELEVVEGTLAESTILGDQIYQKGDLLRPGDYDPALPRERPTNRRPIESSLGEAQATGGNVLTFPPRATSNDPLAGLSSGARELFFQMMSGVERGLATPIAEGSKNRLTTIIGDAMARRGFKTPDKMESYTIEPFVTQRVQLSVYENGKVVAIRNAEIYQGDSPGVRFTIEIEPGDNAQAIFNNVLESVQASWLGTRPAWNSLTEPAMYAPAGRPFQEQLGRISGEIVIDREGNENLVISTQNNVVTEDLIVGLLWGNNLK